MYKDYYSILMIPITSSGDDVEKKYKKLKKEYEHNADTDEEKSLYADIIEAYLVLANSSARTEYDQFYNNLNHGSEDCDSELNKYILKAQRIAQKHVSELKSSEYWIKRSRKIKIISLISLAVLLTIVLGIYIIQHICYVPGYDRSGKSMLNYTNLKGDVVKIEVINSSTIPITETGAINYDNRTTFDIYQANSVVEFDGHGNIKSYKAYSLKGKEIFNVTDFRNDLMENMVNAFPCPSDNEKLTLGHIEWKKRGYASRAVYYSGNKKVWDKRMKYNEHDDLIQIVKEYCPLRVTTNLGFVIEYKDTTNISYLQYDEHGNWTLARVEYQGFTKRQHYVYHVKRQITYNKGWKKSALIKQLPQFIAKENEDMKMPQMIRKSSGEISCDIPIYFVSLSENDKKDLEDFGNIPINLKSYIALYQTPSNLPYATLHIREILQKDDDLTEYDLNDVTYVDKETDEANRKMMEEFLPLGHARLLWWEPSEIVKIDGKKAIKYSYYYVAGGNTIPSYATIFTIPIGNTKTICLMYAYTTSMGAYYQQVFDKTVQSIDIAY